LAQPARGQEPGQINGIADPRHQLTSSRDNRGAGRQGGLQGWEKPMASPEHRTGWPINRRSDATAV